MCLSLSISTSQQDHENLLESNAIYQEIYNSQIEGGGDFDQPS